MAKISDDEYEMLTEEERVGLKEYQAELEAEKAAEDALIAAAANGDPEDPSPETPDKPVKPEKPEKPTKAEDEPDEDEEEVDDDEDPIDTEEEAEESAEEEVEDQTGAADVDEEDPPAQPRKKAAEAVIPALPRLTDAEEKRLVAIKTQLKELAQKFDDGELTAVEWRDQQETLEDERDVLKEKRAVAAMTTQASVNTWYHSTIPLFLGEHPEYKDGSLRHKLLDTVVRELQMASTTPTDPKILIAAHKRITEELGPVNGEEKSPVPKKKSNGQKRPSPPKFADIPTSDQNEVTQPNKFARLDKLNGVDYERALSKLTPADREFYLQGGG